MDDWEKLYRDWYREKTGKKPSKKEIEQAKRKLLRLGKLLWRWTKPKKTKDDSNG